MSASSWNVGPVEWIEFGLTALLILFAYLWTPAIQRRLGELAASTKLCMIALAAIPVGLRLLLLPNHPVPKPDIYDEFSHLPTADTLLHWRLANPAHPLHQFFETFFVLQEPTYSSIYPLGQGLLLAFGRAISPFAWTGVLLCSGVFCACCYWALRGYIAPIWSLLGGVLATVTFGPLNLWTNCYWGGTLAATGGCLVFGGLPRLLASWRAGTRPRMHHAVFVGIGFGLHMLTRQFESVLLALSVAAFFGAAAAKYRANWRIVGRSAAIVIAAATPVLLLILAQNKSVTGAWTPLPEQLSQYQYGVPTTLTIQAPATPHVPLTREQALDYKAQLLTHGPDRDTFRRFGLRMLYRIRYYRFFFLPPLYLAAIGYLFALRRPVFQWVALTVLLFALGTNLFPYLLVHYLAGVTYLFVLISVVGLEQISRLRIRQQEVGSEIVRVIVILCLTPFAVWYFVHLFERHVPLAILQFETWDSINHQGPRRRMLVDEKLAAIPGKLLVFVRYGPNHIFQEEWVWNAANIDSSRVVWARDLGEAADQELMRYYADRRALWLEPDFENPVLETVTP